MSFSYGDQRIQAMSKEAFGKLVRNETIDELCTWLHSCLAQVDPNSEVYKACTSMVNAMAGKKSSDTANLGTTVDSDGSMVTHYPLPRK